MLVTITSVSADTVRSFLNVKASGLANFIVEDDAGIVYSYVKSMVNA